jgi:hypothetical protein
MPEWLKLCPPVYNDKQTVKRCIPFLDAMSVGYMLLTHIPIIIVQEADSSIRLKFLDDIHKHYTQIHPPIETHSSDQLVHSPIESMTILKYMSPWIIETPKDYSLLFVPPLNRLDNPIIPLSGLVDSDKFFSVVNIPFVSPMLQPGGELYIPVGTPVCQIIPIKRDSWSSSNSILDPTVLRQARDFRIKMNYDREGWYSNHAHVKKGYN